MSFGTLTFTTADGRKRTAPINTPMLRIGRNPDNDVVIDDPSVSGYHARIYAGEGGLRIIDVGSRNGTEVDGRPIERVTPLTPASRIRVGAIVLTLTPAGAAPPPPADGFVLPDFPVAPAPASAPAATGETAAAPTGAARAAGPPLVRLELVPPLAKADISQGGPAVLTYTATVHNLSRFVDHLDLAIEGPPWAVAVIDPPFHNLTPGLVGTSRVTLTVARAPECTAGAHTIELVARSEKRPELRFTAASELTVTPFTEFRFELLEPKARTAWTGGRFRTQVVNGSNRSVPFNFEGLNPDGALSFRFDPDPIELKAGERGESAVRARFGFFRLFGQRKTHDFTLTAEPLDQSAPIQQAQGRLIQSPPLPPWMLILGAVLSLLALLLACSSLLYNNRGRLIGLFENFFPPATATVGPALPPTVDLPGALASAEAGGVATQAAGGTAVAQTAEAVQGENSETQTAVASAGAATQAALQTGAAGTQTAVASQVAGTATAQSGQVAATQTAAAGSFAGTATAQANATGTALAGTIAALNRTPTPTPALPVTPTPTLPPPAAAGQVITFDRLRGLAVNLRVPIVGDEYAGQDAFFCFYRPSRLGSAPAPERAGAADLARPLAALGAAGDHVAFAVRPLSGDAIMAQQPFSPTVSISRFQALEGSTGGTTNFTFSVTFSLPQSTGSDLALSVQYITADGGLPGTPSATSPADYLPQSGTAVVVIPEGGTSATATVTIAVVADFDNEPDEAFSVTLSNPSSGLTIGNGTATGLILNDDLPPTVTPTPSPTQTPTITPSPVPAPLPPPSGDGFNCQPPAPEGTSLQLLRAVIYPPPVQAANNAPLHSLTTDAGENRLVSDSIAVVNFRRNVAEVNVDVWYPGGEAAAYVMFAFDERGALIATARRDAIGVPSAYQLNIRSLERPVRQVVIEARREFAGEFSGSYNYAPVVPPLLSRVELRYTNP